VKVNKEIVPGTRKEPKDHCVKHYIIIYGGVQQNEETLRGVSVVLKSAERSIPL
jgi:hypothetical protein